MMQMDSKLFSWTWEENRREIFHGKTMKKIMEDEGEREVAEKREKPVGEVEFSHFVRREERNGRCCGCHVSLSFPLSLSGFFFCCRFLWSCWMLGRAMALIKYNPNWRWMSHSPKILRSTPTCSKGVFFSFFFLFLPFDFSFP